MLVVKKIRIAASKCKREIQRPATSPISQAMIVIFYIMDNFKRQQMQQLLENERKVVTMYEETLGCKVNK